MNATPLLNESENALRTGNRDRSKRLIQQVLREEPDNDTAWVYLAHAESQIARKRSCLRYALKINPDNFAARLALAKLTGESVDPPTNTPLTSSSAITKGEPKATQRQITRHLKDAKRYKRKYDFVRALREWLAVLAVEVDHQEALQAAVDALRVLGYPDDAEELLGRALDAGSKRPFVYVEALRLADQRGDIYRVEALRDRLLRLPLVDDATIVQTLECYFTHCEIDEVRRRLHHLIVSRPKSQTLLIKLGDVYALQGEKSKALLCFNRAASMGRNAEAAKRVAAYPPILTDRERGSTMLALREASGAGLFYFFLAWQDARLDILNMSALHWMGVALGLVGAYLLVTAISSPQQRWLAAKLGGRVQTTGTRSSIIQQKDGKMLHEVSRLPIIPGDIRTVLAVGGGGLMLVALVLVFGDSMNLLFDYLSRQTGA